MLSFAVIKLVELFIEIFKYWVLNSELQNTFYSCDMVNFA
jgi:hypothetical protein